MFNMQRLSDLTLGDIVKGLGRYRPFILLVVAIALIVLLLPGKPTPATRQLTSGTAKTTGKTLTSNPYGDSSAGTTGATDVTTPGTPVAGGTLAAGGGATSTKKTAAAGTPAAGGGTAAAAGATTPAAVKGAGPDCDPATGRVRVPSVYAFPCVAPFSGDNGGNTYKGVTKDSITIAIYVGPPDPTTQAILAAGGDNDTDAQRKSTRQDFVTFFERHSETYGRQVKLCQVDGSGASSDDAAGKADAIRVDTECHAFMSWGSPNNAYLNELTARGILCVCTTTLPKDFYLAHAPYVWGNGLPDENQAYIMRAEMIGKQIARNAAGKPYKAHWAGDPGLTLQDRKFGLIYYETTDKAYAAGEKFFEQELSKYKVTLADRAAYIFDANTAQQDSQTIMSKFASEGITSVIFVGDPIYPTFYTQAATNQGYHPEWIITGSALTDETFFARIYDQTQWQHAFGMALLGARAPKEVGEAYRLYGWQFNGAVPAASAEAGIIYPTVFLTFVGIHLAGPNLNAQTYRDGMFSYPVSPAKAGITNYLISWGRQLWSWDDYNLYDDSTLIWYDATATGNDENGKAGTGMYRYIDGGKRYLPGGFGANEIKAFDTNGTVLVYDTLPDADKHPDYPHKDYHNTNVTCC